MKWSRPLVALALIFALASCAKDGSPSGDLNGGYYGIYERTDGVVDTSATVRIVFVGSNFSGESQANVRPICNGNYAITGDSINFTNLCSTPDDELLLVGKYQIRETGDSLYLSRLHELYSLKQQ
jgi:hypothetical protein